ncbi:MAG: hypothetical protein LBH06_07270 [Rikenellaceae bacterium]|jgi:hypothetical protein|nr:hypothetical protein [Rikenellaceae bacterium]
MIKIYKLILFFTALTTVAAAQEGPKEANEEAKKEAGEGSKGKAQAKKGLDVSGYVHAQWIATPEKRDWGGHYISTAGGGFTPEVNNRFTVRRCRIKFAYNNDVFSVVAQPDFKERGIKLVDAYAGVNSRSKSYPMGLKVGLYAPPFGYEIERSPTANEFAERSRTILALFPSARDVGAGGSIAAPGGFALDAGMFNGNGVAVENDSYKDFVGRVRWLRRWGGDELGAAVSYRRGAVPGGSSRIYRAGEGFVPETTEHANTYSREYAGFSLWAGKRWSWGLTSIATEWTLGRQPSEAGRFANIAGTGFTSASDLYMRDFVGGYAALVHRIGRTRHSVEVKYDYLDPNRRVRGNEIGLAATGVTPATAADLAYTTVSFGYVYDMNAYVRLLAQYDLTRVERSTALAGFTPADRLRQDVLTLRLQVRVP